MNAALLGLLCALASAVGLALLGANDPKRRRTRNVSRPRTLRMPALALALGPGLWLAATGRGVSFLLWIGATAVLGWAVTALVNRWSDRAADAPGRSVRADLEKAMR